MGPPRSSWLSGESGGTSRLNDDEVSSQCDFVAEREILYKFLIIVLGTCLFCVRYRNKQNTNSRAPAPLSTTNPANATITTIATIAITTAPRATT